MIALYLAPVYILFHLFLGWRILRWLKTVHPVFNRRPAQAVICLLICLVMLSPLGGAFASGSLQKISRILFNHYLGSLLYLILTLLVLDIGTFLYKRIKHEPLRSGLSPKALRIRGTAVLLITAAISAYGIVNAYTIRTKTYEVSVDKEFSGGELKIALVADLHLGANVGVTQMKHMVKKINAMEPDLVVFAGDIFDNDFDAITEPETVQQLLGSITSTYGSYACWGNHDIDETILAGFTFRSSKDTEVSSDPRMDQLLTGAGITLLEDETVLIDDSFYLTGRIDYSAKDKNAYTRKTPEELLHRLDQSKPLIVIDHQPRELTELSEAGADLTLSGHTHNGQNFPGNLIMPLIWENPCGMIRVGSMTDIVTSGVGIWGPAMRVGTDSEVVEINLSFR